MDDTIKSGKQILYEFFDKLQELEGVDIKVAEKLKKLYNQNKFTDKYLSNIIGKIKEDILNDKN